jgi:peptidoglycan/LPS O-acetylase OafA/YrhL
MRSALVCVSLGTALLGAFLVHDDPVLRPLDLHALWGIGAGTGVLVSLAFLLDGGRPGPVRHAGKAFSTGLIALGIGMSFGHSVTDSSLGLWLQLGVSAAIGLLLIMIAAAVTHLPARQQAGGVHDPEATDAPRFDVP